LSRQRLDSRKISSTRLTHGDNSSRRAFKGEASDDSVLDVAVLAAIAVVFLSTGAYLFTKIEV
jgi:hypothetical protein